MIGEKPFTYIYCNTKQLLNQLRNHFMSLTIGSAKVPIFLDCEGRDLGRTDGKLGLVQLGIEVEIYIVDIVEIAESLDILKMILEHETFEKVLWDGRNDYAELWHGHGIDMSPVLDLQLVRIHETSSGRGRGFTRLDGMGKVFSAMNRDSTVNARGNPRDIWLLMNSAGCS